MQRARQAAVPLSSATSSAVRAGAAAAMASVSTANASSSVSTTSSEPKFPLEVFETLTNATGDSTLVFSGDGAGAYSSENVSNASTIAALA
jgi:hypothetical protein